MIIKNDMVCENKIQGTGYCVHKRAVVLGTVVVRDMAAAVAVVRSTVVVQGILVAAGRKIVEAVDPGMATQSYRAVAAVVPGKATMQ